MVRKFNLRVEVCYRDYFVELFFCSAIYTYNSNDVKNRVAFQNSSEGENLHNDDDNVMMS